MRFKNYLIDIVYWFFGFGFILFGTSIISPNNAFAFSKLKNGFETLTTSYLIPLSDAISGCAFIVFIMLSYFKQEENQKKAATVLMLSIFARAGLSVVKTINETFA